MSNKPIISWLAISTLTFILFLTGCEANAVKIGWRETSSLSSKTAQFVTFDGIDRVAICAKAEQTISLDYEVAVSKGTLNIALNSPDGTSVWQETFNQDAADAVTLPSTDSGCYTLQFVGEKTGGSLDFAWEVED